MTKMTKKKLTNPYLFWIKKTNLFILTNKLNFIVDS
jgi:hypothetical protein